MSWRIDWSENNRLLRVGIPQYWGGYRWMNFLDCLKDIKSRLEAEGMLKVFIMVTKQNFKIGY